MKEKLTLLCFVESLLTILLLTSCTMRPAKTSGVSMISPSASEELFSEVTAAVDSAHYEVALAKADALMRGNPGFDRMEDVYFLAAKASFFEGEYRDAIRYVAVLQEKFPASGHLWEAMLISAESSFKLGRYFQCTDEVMSVLNYPLQRDLEERALRLQAAARPKLGPAEIKTLLKKYPSAHFSLDLSLDVAKREFAMGHYAETYDILADLLYRFPQDKRAPEIRRLLRVAADRRTSPSAESGLIDPFKIGAVLPITGESSLYGRYFDQGLTLALEEYDSTADSPISLVRADTKGNPVEAVKAVRELIHEDGVLAVLGGVLTVPTITASVEANAWGVPMLSPVVTSDELPEIGRWIFQTRVSGEVEVTAIAKLAAKQLLLQRYAVLAPSSGYKRRLADFFVREISSIGGDIVAVQYFEPGATDFKNQLEAIRESSPEAVFIPARAEELMLILPQIDFYDLQVQLLGLSDWNSPKLVRISSKEMEGALFPLESYHGEDASVYQNFLVLHREKIGEDVNPITTAGYFGMRAVLQAVRNGTSNREEMRKFLSDELYGDAKRRMGEADALSILTVHEGRITEFEAPSPSDN